MIFEIYCDGSTRGNGQENSVGAWAWLVHEGEKIINQDACAEKNTTNQRMELTAAIKALNHTVYNYLCPGFDKVVVYTDSAYLHNCYTQKWYVNWQKNGWKNAKKQPVANQDLWEQLIGYFEMPGVEFVKVKGHAGNHYNEIVDTMAQNASEALKNENSNN
jgi:ribonuclease HI